MKTVCIINDIAWDERPFDQETTYDKNKLRFAYEVLCQEAFKKNIRFVMTNLDWYSNKNNNFQKGWTFIDGIWEKLNDISYNYIFDKFPTNSKTIPIKQQFDDKGVMVNELEFEDFCYDKSKTQEYLSEFSPKSFTINSTKELQKKIAKITTKKVVIKPIIGSGAHGVKIINKEKAQKLDIKETNLLQEFIESKKFPEHGEYEVYDMRFFVLNGEIINGYYRFSQLGVLTSNVSTGGRIKMFQTKDIDAKLLKFIVDIDTKIANRFVNRFYAIDIVVDPNNRPVLIELNSKAGFWICDEPELRRICRNLVNIFVQNN
jgi:glutathione synthase/RimK-type ligase-like ATP-grasp enzyme